MAPNLGKWEEVSPDLTVGDLWGLFWSDFGIVLGSFWSDCRVYSLRLWPVVGGMGTEGFGPPGLDNIFFGSLNHHQNGPQRPPPVRCGNTLSHCTEFWAIKVILSSQICEK